ncbi:Predicted choloylglycine hydrolase [Thiothrix eikelboomii]|uniref:Predicted choloylglycine hydrolase n=1 Tax=Thiothrix eikelboomii TaxID=92487 RepID=A0A1T4XV87_9GAMM|nr:C45 family peptidase [Thiothrix eikelboomii]SKA93466.1 Predicted choloylglycine hydrolase [Thiothrix eikelboomii]
MKLQYGFHAMHEAWPDTQWQALFNRAWPAYQRWFLKKGIGQQPTYLQSLRQLRAYMPELLPIYERLCELAGGGDTAARFLSMYCPPPYYVSCSQAVWTKTTPFLIRNYDYHPALLEGTVMHSSWLGKPVIASGDCLWGVLDGMNSAGLVVSLAFGGRKLVGIGFGIPLILRYILETCRDLADAVAVLRHIPSHMAYNITLLDRLGEACTVLVAPDRQVQVNPLAIATNHQQLVEWPQHALATATLERESFLIQSLANAEQTAEEFIHSFLQPPLYSTQYARGFGTLYTALYRPDLGSMTLLWPHRTWQQSLEAANPAPEG